MSGAGSDRASERWQVCGWEGGRRGVYPDGWGGEVSTEQKEKAATIGVCRRCGGSLRPVPT